MSLENNKSSSVDQGLLSSPFSGRRGLIAIIKYNAGNVQSVQYALQRLNAESIVTDDATIIRNADKVIFPGVGHAAPAMQYLIERGLDKLITSLQQPVLGICLGLQLMCKHSEEGDTKCLGIFDEDVKLFAPTPPVGTEGQTGSSFKVPQIGWNSISNYKSILFDGLPDGAYVYAVHSYYAALGNETIATTNYILPYSAALQKNNFYAVQFHPEKSGTAGATILKNFINLL
jgi:imidazole glycerol-phosphate synthase subunit HisH